MLKGIDRCRIGLLASVAAAILAPAAASAQEAVPAPTAPAAETPKSPQDPSDEQASDGKLEDIVVTAQRREERLQRVPISVAAFSGETLASSNIGSTLDLSTRVAGFVGQARTGSFIPYLRGVGSVDPNPTNESIVSTYVDGVYLVNPTAGFMSLANVERIEILKGPQGTLFGRNSMGGVVNIITKTPTQDPHANFEFGYGNYDTVNAKAYVTGGLATNLSASIAGSYQHQGKGWGKNLDSGLGVGYVNFGATAAKLYLDLPKTQVTLSGDYSYTDSDVSATLTPYYLNTKLYGGGTCCTNFFDDAGPDPTFNRIKQYGTSLRVSQDVGFADLVSISAYRHTNAKLSIDQDNKPVRYTYITVFYDADDFTQELQLNSKPGSKISWVVGGFYLHHKVSPVQTVLSLNNALVSNRSVFDYSQQTVSLAGYAQATVPIADQLRFTAGFRFTSDDQTFEKVQTLNGVNVPVPNIDHSKVFNKATWRLALDYRITDDVMVYAAQSRGFKSGLWNITVANPNTTNPETLDSYEVGFKSQMFNDRVRFNAAAFQYNYKNIQYNLTLNNIAQVFNAATARLQGLDVDGSWAPAKGLTINAGAVWLLKRRYTSFNPGQALVPSGTVINGTTVTCVPNGLLPAPVNCSYTGDFTGRYILLAPALSLSGSIDYKHDLPSGSLAFNLTGSYSSKMYRSIDNILTQPAYGVLNGSIRWNVGDDGLSLTLWAKNLTDTHYSVYGTATTYTFSGGRGAPRTFGGSIGYKF